MLVDRRGGLLERSLRGLFVGIIGEAHRDSPSPASRSITSIGGSV
jgi:hypothetical protein